MSKAEINKSRLVTLDRLRGFFIVVIIADHLSRWPSIFSLITGKALLWVTAAEGFVAISGLLVGYVRGFKNRSLPLRAVSKKLLGRALLLYVWAIIGTVVYTWIVWNIPLQGGSPGLPFDNGDWTSVLLNVLTLQHTFVWVHFLGLYALFLAASPLAIWLLRQRKAWAVGLISFGLLTLGWYTESEPLQWQFLFFIPSIAGFYLETILLWWKNLTATRRTQISSAVVTTTAATVILSVVTTYYNGAIPGLSALVNPLFEKDSISLLRAGMAFLWFIGFVFIFHWVRAFIAKTLDWLLIPIGTHSLTAYILHGVAISIVSFFTISGTNWFMNSILGAITVLLVWGMLRIPYIHRFIPR